MTLRHARDAGISIVEVLVACAVLAVVVAFSVPAVSSATDASRIRSAAAFVAGQFRLARIEAVNRSRHVGVVFDQVAGRWQMRICRDGNGNGLRRAEIASGADPCLDGPHDFSAMFPGVAIAVDPRLPGPAGEPGNPDPVRFGSPDIASFAPTGGCTAGSLFLRSQHGQQFAIRMAGANGRLRMFRYDAGPRSWFAF